MKEPTYKELKYRIEELERGMNIVALVASILIIFFGILGYYSSEDNYKQGFQDGLNNASCNQPELNCILPAKEITINNKTDCFLEYHYVTYNMDGSNFTDTVSYIQVGTGEMLK